MASGNVRKNIALLASCQGLGMTSHSVVIAVSALTGAMLAEDKSLATVPHAILWLSTMAASPLLAGYMKRRGRREGFMLGSLSGLVAACLCVYAIFEGDFWLFTAAMIFQGVFNTCTMFYRFAAGEAADEAFRAKAIALVIGGGVLAAVVGPELAKQTRELFDPVFFAGTFAALSVLPILIAGVMLFIDFPPPPKPDASAPVRPLGVIARQPQFVVALAVAAFAWTAMVLIMTATPLSMVQDSGHSFADSAFVIQWHMLGMYVPSFFSGWLISRVGVMRVIWAGIALYTASMYVGLSGTEVWHFALMNLFIGAGWNFQFVGATELLARTHTPAERSKVQGFNDFVVFGSVAAATFFSGKLQFAYGWDIVNWLLLPGILATAILIIWLQMRRVTVAAE